jgi:hypothetical protein
LPSQTFRRNFGCTDLRADEFTDRAVGLARLGFASAQRAQPKATLRFPRPDGRKPLKQDLLSVLPGRPSLPAKRDDESPLRPYPSLRHFDIASCSLPVTSSLRSRPLPGEASL